MKNALVSAVLAAGFFAGPAAASADLSIEIDPDAAPLKDVRKSTCGPEVGYAGCFMECGRGDDFWFGENADETARAMKEAGAWFQRMWGADQWFAHRVPSPDGKYKTTNPDLAFRFWKDNGIRLLFTVEPWGADARDRIREFVQWIVDNGYQDVVAGFELGNETYYSPDYPKLAPVCEGIIDDILRIWPQAKIGINLAELFENNPDIPQVRARMLAEGKIDRTTYFSAADFNRYSAQFVVAMSNCIGRVTHVIYHGYGADTPYSCSYYGIKRFRNFMEAFPELAGKRMWLSEVRPRSDEDNRCQRIFREALVMAHFSLMAISQPDVDGFNHHQIYALSGGIYQSNGKTWQIQWRDAGPDYADGRSPGGRPRLDVGACGVMYRILAEAIREHPLLLAHGTAGAKGDEDAFCASARVMDQVYARRRALKEGKRAPAVKGELEWVAAATPDRGGICLLMVNTKSEPQRVRVSVKGRQTAAPTYRTLSCPERFLDCREVPGDGKPWTQLSWEDTQTGFEGIPMSPYENLAPAAGALEIEIAPHTVQSVSFRVRKAK